MMLSLNRTMNRTLNRSVRYAGIVMRQMENTVEIVKW
jgi:hypothetical protein